MIKNLFDTNVAQEIISRLDNLHTDSPKKWGNMSIDQMLEHCSLVLDMAIGKKIIKRVFIGYLLGRIFKKNILKDESIGEGRPTSSELMTTDKHFDIESEKLKLKENILLFVSTPQEQVAKSIHPFFGALSAEQRGVQMRKHLDHHFRQFGA